MKLGLLITSSTSDEMVRHVLKFIFLFDTDAWHSEVTASVLGKAFSAYINIFRLDSVRNRLKAEKLVKDKY